jgi:hypothetical protein
MLASLQYNIQHMLLLAWEPRVGKLTDGTGPPWIWLMGNDYYTINISIVMRYHVNTLLANIYALKPFTMDHDTSVMTMIDTWFLDQKQQQVVKLTVWGAVWCHGANYWLVRAGTYLGFCSIKWLGA